MFRNLMIILIALGFIYILTGCDDEASVNSPTISGDWLIPSDQVFDGGPGKDGIPALVNASFIDPAQATYLKDDDLVIGVEVNGEIRAYPHPILDWHEIINDQIGQTHIAVTYCPLTGSGIGWNRNIQGEVTTFGVSGLLYNTNLIPYDRATNSNWSQMTLKAVNGQRIGLPADLIPMVETTWKTWKDIYPSSKVVSNLTGYNRQYGLYPYSDYRTNHSRLLFPVNVSDSRLPRKERVLGILGTSGSGNKVYQISAFPDGIGVIHDNIGNESVVVAGSAGHNFGVVYKRMLAGGVELSFSPIQDSLPAVMVDNEGTTWDVFGTGLSGPRAGQKLEPTRSFIAYWFAWVAFYPNPEIAGQ
jgi:hypothetical protein